MNNVLQQVNSFLYKDFIFSPRYRMRRHLLYWIFNIMVWAIFWLIMDTPASFWRNVLNMSLWVPVFILFSYPLVYVAVPQLLLKGKVWQFFLLILAWGAFGLVLNSAFSTYLYIPLQELMGFKMGQLGFQAHSYLCMTTSAASPMLIRFFKLLTFKQQEWVRVQEEKVAAELQLLKAQVHPHFLFNTLNNIYSFSLENFPKTAELILKLSSLLSYMLNNCNTDKVFLTKEIEVMKNYMDLEKERYGNKLKIKWHVEGDLENKSIVPLLLLPFLENAFKHGLSEQIEEPTLDIYISVTEEIFICKIANSKNENVQQNKKGIGINNVKKRLKLLYPGRHELTIANEPTLFVVSMILMLPEAVPTASFIPFPSFVPKKLQHETSLPAYR